MATAFSSATGKRQEGTVGVPVLQNLCVLDMEGLLVEQWQLRQDGIAVVAMELMIMLALALQ
ncbi:MAG: hypothetical protein GY792_06380 [Gammaproteobacteria bacterium]|nr:hypothetical protein [Gammaproteobacteria bacterium]